jgi:hypothetical protein
MKRRKPRRGDAVRALSDTTAPTAPDGDGLAKAGKRKNNGNGANLGFEASFSSLPTSCARTSNRQITSMSRLA